MSESDPRAALIVRAQHNISDILHHVFAHTAQQKTLLVHDTRSALSRLLTAAYRTQLPEAQYLDFDACETDTVLRALAALAPGDLAILIQSTSFRLNRFRIRIELFQQKIKVIEHPHLGRMRQSELSTYIDALAYDPAYYRRIGPALQEKIADAYEISIFSEGATLKYDTAFLSPKLNIGDYGNMKNIGGQFPIGEVFTEAEQLERVNGRVTFFAFGDTQFSVQVPEKPFTVIIEKGILVDSPDAPEEFLQVLREIREKEGVVWVRELGFGLNRAFTATRRVSDIGTYERMCGIHLSLGSKHLQYKKVAFPKKGGFHVDAFVKTGRVEINGIIVYQEGHYLC